MGTPHNSTLMEHARDELLSQVIRRAALEAHVDEGGEWVEEAIECLAHRYPQLNILQLTYLRIIGARFYYRLRGCTGRTEIATTGTPRRWSEAH